MRDVIYGTEARQCRIALADIRRQAQTILRQMRCVPLNSLDYRALETEFDSLLKQIDQLEEVFFVEPPPVSRTRWRTRLLESIGNLRDARLSR